MKSRTKQLPKNSSWPLILIDTSVLMADPDVLVRIIANGGMPVITDTVLAGIESALADDDQALAPNSRSTFQSITSAALVEMSSLPNGRAIQSGDSLRRLSFKDCPVYLLNRTPASGVASNADAVIALARDYGMQLITRDSRLQARAELAGVAADLWTGPRTGDSGQGAKTPALPIGHRDINHQSATDDATNANAGNNKTKLINRTGRSAWLVVFALLALALVIALNRQKAAVQSGPGSAPTSEKRTYENDVQRLVNLAASADAAALTRFEKSLATATAKYETDSIAAAEGAAASVSTYDSIIHVIGHLAFDQIRGTDEASAYLQARVSLHVTPPFDALAVGINATTAELDNELKKISVQLAVDLAALGPGASALPRKFAPSGQVQQDFDNTLRNLGISAAALSVAAAFDIYAVVNTTVVKTFVRTLASIANKLLARQVTKTVVAIMAAAADGPLPGIGDFVAVAFGLSTVYAISRLKPEFHRQVNTQSAKHLNEIGAQCEAQAREYARTRVESIKKVQLQIGRESLKALAN